MLELLVSQWTHPLHRNSAKLDNWGLDSAVMLRNAGWESIDPEDRGKCISKVKSKFQSCARIAFVRRDRPDNIGRIRAKLTRWHLAGIERHTAERCARLLQRLAKLVPPRVAHAVWRTMWNGWTSARRFQQPSHHCHLCCNSGAMQDSIEHYAMCKVTGDLCTGFVGLSPVHYSRQLGNFVVLGVNYGKVDDATLVKRAVVVYAIYRATNHLRHAPSTSHDFIKDLIVQFARESVKGHVPATRMLEARVGASTFGT